MEGYVAAVTSACTIAIALNAVLQRAGAWSPTTKMIVQRFIPFPAVGKLERSCLPLSHLSLPFTLSFSLSLSLPPSLHVATASTLNAVLMRNHELREGITVIDEQGKEIGTSIVAARAAVTETAITRAILPAPILLIPPVVMVALEK